MESIWDSYGCLFKANGRCKNLHGIHAECIWTHMQSLWRPCGPPMHSFGIHMASTGCAHRSLYGTSVDSMRNEDETHVAHRWAHMEGTRNPYMESTWTHKESMCNVYGLICSPYGIYVECVCAPVESTSHPQAVHMEAYME
eukprot:278567-Karenia_brevis.AAC.3